VTAKEAEWLQLAIQGDEQAFEELVNLYQKPVYNLCYRMLGNANDAEDAAQETFWRAYQALKRYDKSRSFITWLLSIAAHYCIDQHRKRKLPTIDFDVLPEETIPVITPQPEKVMMYSEQEKQVTQILNSLPSQDRAAIVLRYWYQFSEEEISSALSMSVSAVKSRMHRSRKKIAEYLVAQGIEHYSMEEVI